MLRNLRERTKTILWIVVLTFVISIFAVWGMDLQGPKKHKFDANIVGNVDKHAITQQVYNNVLNQLYSQVKMQRGENYAPSDMERSLLADQAWEYAVQGMLMQREIDRLHITVSDAELVSFIRQNPPPEFQNAFKTEDGQFDYQGYLKALADPQFEQYWPQLEAWGRSRIPDMKLQTYLVSEVHIPENEVLERFKVQNVTMKARYVQIPIQKREGAPYEPSDAELRSLYEQKKADFKAPAMRRVRVIEIEKKPTAADEEDVRARAADIREDIVKGTLDFAGAAKEYSDDNSTSDKGGDLGFFKKGEMAPEFDAAAFALKPGQVSEPVRTQFGYNIIKVEAHKTEKGIETIHARNILMKVEPGTDTIDSLQLVLRDISTEIHDKGFEKTAADRKLKTFDTEPFAQGMFIKELGFAPRVASFAFNYGAGTVSYGIDGETSIRLVKVLEAIPEQERAFEQVRPQLVEELRADRDAEAALAIAESLRKDILSSGSFDAAAKAKGFTVKETPSFKADDAIPEIGTNTTFQAACTFLALNAVSPPIKGQGRYFLIKIIERTEPDMAKFVEARQGIVSEMRNELANRFMASWYQSIRDNAKVEDLREKPLQ
jgi:peptidyl-prolyl cis-trans isomerase D